MVCFQTKNPNLGKLWRVLQWKMMVCIFYGHLVHFTVVCCILWTFGKVRGYWYFPPFWYFVLRKIWHPWVAGVDKKRGRTIIHKAMSLIT
jgi:hypothetical protein